MSKNSYRTSRIDKQILAIAGPSIVSNVTIPLLGLADIAIVGHLGAAVYISALAAGSVLFNALYMIFGFLRMGMGGLTAQAFGRKDEVEIVALLFRSLFISTLISIVLLSTQTFIMDFAFDKVIAITANVRIQAETYFSICVFGIPAALCIYSFTGWFLGMQNTRIPMLVALSQNVVNIAASYLLALHFSLGIKGVAIGTVMAQYFGLAIFAACWFAKHRYLLRLLSPDKILHKESVFKFFHVNRDIFFRTLLLMSVTVFFTSSGAKSGSDILAANALLMQFFTLFSYILDGFAYSAEAITGKYVGAGDKQFFVHTVRRVFAWGSGLALIVTLVYLLMGKSLLSLLTDNAQVVAIASDYLRWVLLIPLASFSAFIWDGVYIGTTSTKQMLLSVAASTVLFFILYLALHAHLGNHALWLAFIIYLAGRGIMQTHLFKKVCHSCFPQHTAT